ncbi:MAG: peptide chain release factor N(5)-glutamine methyltransferase [Brevinema sp.]
MTLEAAHQFLQNELSSLPECHEECLRIIEHCTGWRRFEISTAMSLPLDNKQWDLCQEIARRRKTGEPLAHILGYFWFYKHRFPVSRQTLIPRYDTECLIEHAIALKPKKILDIGTGTGAIALSLASELPQADIWAIDIVDQPFRFSEESLGIHSVEFIHNDFLDQSLWKELPTFDMIISNPPYLDDADMNRLDPSVKNWEPHSALYAGRDGMIFYRAIHHFCETHLQQGAYCLLEVDHKYLIVEEIFKEYNCTIKKDLSGLERLLIARKES